MGMTWQEKTERRLRELNRSRRDLAKHLGRPMTTVNKWFQHKSEPGWSEGIKLARYIEVSADWLFDEAQAYPEPARAAGADRTAQLVGLLRRALDEFTSQAGLDVDTAGIVDRSHVAVDPQADPAKRATGGAAAG